LQEFETARMTERELAQAAEEALVDRMWQAERDKRAWRIAAIVAVILAGIGWIL